MMQVWKFPLDLQDYVTIQMPKGARILHCAEQRGVPCLWVLVDPTMPSQQRRFRIAGTGHEITEHQHCLNHVGSFLMHMGRLVFHVFEVPLS